MKKMITVAIATVMLAGCGSGSNHYDKAIGEVIKKENIENENTLGIQKDIDKLERDMSCTKVYQDGKVISITYEIRKNDPITRYYVKADGQYESDISGDNYLEDDEKPIFTENCNE